MVGVVDEGFGKTDGLGSQEDSRVINIETGQVLVQSRRAISKI